MGRLLNFFRQNLLKILVSFLIIFIPLYPKLPSVHINHTWVYIRLEDFAILLTVLVWLLQFMLRKVKLPPKIWTGFAFYWAAGLASLVFSLIFIGPHIANFFPKVAALYYLRHIEYLSLFFVAFSTVRSRKDLRDYLIILSATVVAFSAYAFGQRFYLDLWAAFPKFFEHYSFCFPSFQTGNEQFAKGIPLCLPKGARITSTFAGHYDLAAYLVMLIPVFTALIFAVKKRLYKILAFLLTLISIMVMIFTSSRVSFIAYLVGIAITLWLIKKKKYIIPFFALSVVLLLIFSGSTAKRFMETFRLTSVVVNNQGQVVGQLPQDLQNKVSNNIIANVPTQNLPEGSGYLGLPQVSNLQKTNKAIVQSNLSIEEAKRLKLENGGVQISTISGSFLIKKVLVYDISFTTRFQAEWPNAWNAFLRNPILGSGFATITLAVDNNFLRILGETGLLGMASFLSIFLLLFLVLKQVLPEVSDSLPRAFLLGLVGGVVGLFLNATLIDVFEASKLAESMWIVLGIAAGTAFLYKKDYQYVKYILRYLTSHVFIVFYLFFLLVFFYMRAIGNFFVADDFTWLKWAATTNLPDLPKLFINSQGFFYRPLDKLMMYLLYTVFSFTPNGYHVFMLSIHFLTALGVYILIQKLFKNKVLSFIGAFVFLFLPSQGEDLYWISTMSTNLYALFTVYAILAWTQFRRHGSKIWYIIALSLGLLTFLSYEGSIILLPLIILVDIFVSKIKVYKDSAILSYIPFGIFTLLYPFVRQLTNSVGFGGDYSYSLPHLVPNFVGNFLRYVALYIAGEPVLPYYTMLRDLLKQQALYIATILLFVLLVGAFYIFVNRAKIKKYYKNEELRLAFFALSFSFVALIPFLGLGNLSERYAYLASVGFSILFVLVVRKLVSLLKSKRAVNIFLVVLMLFVGGYYYYQQGLENAEWKEAGRITQRTLGYLRLYYDGNHPNASFYFVNLPIRKDQAWIFPVGLEDGIWFIYRDPSIRIYKITSLSEGMTLSKQKNTFVFAFDKNDNIYAVK